MRLRAAIISGVLVMSAAAGLWAWSYRVHQTVTDGAAELLPEPLKRFYELNRLALVYHSTDPDRWVEMKVHVQDAPAGAHYIDLDLLTPDGPPFDSTAPTWDEAVDRWGEETLNKAGTLPWEIDRRAKELTQSFREGNWEDVVMQSAWISHFIADSTMPLHATKNYKGQESGNVILTERGPNRTVHQRLEWGLPENYPEYYDAIQGDPVNVAHVDDVLNLAWQTSVGSFGRVKEVLDADKAATEADGSFGEVYYKAFDEAMRPMVTERLKRGEEMIASIWLTCWEDAGRPTPPMRRMTVELPQIEGPEGAASDGAPSLLVPLVSLMAGVAGLILGSQLTLAVLRRQRN